MFLDMIKPTLKVCNSNSFSWRNTVLKANKVSCYSHIVQYWQGDRCQVENEFSRGFMLHKYILTLTFF